MLFSYVGIWHLKTMMVLTILVWISFMNILCDLYAILYVQARFVKLVCNLYYFFQFCDVAQVAIVHKYI